MNRVRDIYLDLRDRLPRDPRERIKLLVAGPIAAICVLWLTYWVLSSISLSGPTRPPNTAGFRIADDLTKRLLEREEFKDVGVSVQKERPLALLVSGAVHAEEDLDTLKAFLSEAKSDAEFVYEVVVIPPQ